MSRYTVTLIPGDGIGPEVSAAAVRVLSATGIEFEWQTEIAGACAVGEHGSALPERVLDSIRRNKVALKGPHHARGQGAPIGQRAVAQGARSLRGGPARAEPARGPHAIRKRRPGGGAREHRGTLQRPGHMWSPGSSSPQDRHRARWTKIARLAFDYAMRRGASG